MLRSLLLGATAASLVAGLPQNIDFDVVDAAPKPTALGAPLAATVASQVPTYAPSAAAAAAASAASASPIASNAATGSQKRAFDDALFKRQQACSPNPSGYAQPTVPDTVDAFLNNCNYTELAEDAFTPSGYSLNFTDLQGATQQNGYMGFYTLQSYDTVECQQQCDQAEGCTAFNIYIERDPSVSPGSGCDNPASTFVYKCSLYGLPISAATATNTGQWQDQFQVAITASNGYVKNAPPPAIAGFDGPTELGCAINAPSGYIGSGMYNGVYDPTQCAAACTATTQYDKTHTNTGTYDACNFFVSFVLSDNTTALGTYCAYYTQPWGRQYANNCGQYRGSDYYSVSQAFGYTADPQDPGVVSSSVASSSPTPSTTPSVSTTSTATSSAPYDDPTL